MEAIVKSSYLTTATMILAITAGCAKKTENDVIAEAQECLNKSSSASALDCLSIVDGKTTTASYLIRCAGYVKEQGIADPARLVEIAKGMDAGGSSGMATMMKYLAFSSVAKMDAAWAACSQSGSKGLITLASMSRMATAMIDAANQLGSNPDPAQVKAIICANNASTDLIVGQTAIVAYQQGCVGTNGVSSNPYCDIIKSTGDTADPAAIGVTVKQKMCTN